MKQHINGDPATWDHPIDFIEPEEIAQNPLREFALRMIGLIEMMDTHVTGMRDARIAWDSIAIAFGTSRFNGRTITEIAAEKGITKQALSRPTAKFLRMTGIEPAFGLKSSTARRNYQKCH